MAWNNILVFVFLSFFITSAKAAGDSIEIVVFFKDKSCNYTIDDLKPLPLSNIALERRSKQNIAIDSKDEPICYENIESIHQLGLKIIATSRWLNAAYVKLPNENSLLAQIENLPIVSQWKLQSRGLKTKNFTQASELETQESFTNSYGFSYLMNEQIKLPNIHQKGFEANGIRIAVIDGGFKGVDTIDFFQHLYNDKQLVETWNFTNETPDIYDASNHGTEVLSVLAAYKPNIYKGTAIKAKYYLLKSEIIGSESLIEEFNLVRALEFADSAGVDVINISVGYNDFDDTLFNYQWKDLDGKKSLASIAVDIAVDKGMLVVTSAGNEGFVRWKYITVPADADKVIAVGAVKQDRSLAGFSSRGVDEDPRIKPNLTALGHRIAIINDRGNVVEGYGTSYASPVIAGAAACLWQKYPKANVTQIIAALEQSSDRFHNPDKKYGYGIPNILIVCMILEENLSEEKKSQLELIKSGEGYCLFSPNQESKAVLIFKNAKNKILFKKPLDAIYQGFNCFDESDLKNLKSSIYKIVLVLNGKQIELLWEQ